MPLLRRPVAESKVSGLPSSEYDTVEIIELPDNVDAVAFSMAVPAGGALKAIKTTPLLTMDQAVAAMKKASMFGYRPPSQS